jgi:WD40 repeat protein
MTPPRNNPWRFSWARAAIGILLLALAVAVWWYTPLLPRATLPKATWILELSPDGRHLVTHLKGQVTIWDVGTERPASELPGNLSEFRQFMFSPDGRLLTANGGGLLKLWDVPTGRERLALKVGPPWTDGRSFANPTFSPDGKWLAFRARMPNDQYQVQVWDLKRVRVQASLSVPRVEDFLFSPDGKTLVFETWEEPGPGQSPLGRIHLWNVETGQEKPWFEEKLEPIRVMAFSADGRTLATGQRNRLRWEGEYEVKLWDLATGKARDPWLMPRGVARLHFIADGTRLLARVWLDDDRPKVAFWRHFLIDLRTPPPGGVQAVPFASTASADCRLLGYIRKLQARDPAAPFAGEAVAGVAVGLDAQPPAILELPTLKERSRLNPSPPGDRTVPRLFSADNTLFAAVEEPDLFTPAPPRNPVLEWLDRLLGLNKQAPNFPPQEAKLHVYATDSGRRQGTVPVMPGTWCWFTPDGRTMVVLDPESRPTLWDLPLRKPWDRILMCWAALAACYAGIELLLRWGVKRGVKRCQDPFSL